MGCLVYSVENKTICDLKVNAKPQGSGLDISVGKIPSISVYVANKNVPVNIYIINTNTSVDTSTTNKNTGVNIMTGLICRVNLDRWEAFYVTQGPLIVENGYFKVGRMS